MVDVSQMRSQRSITQSREHNSFMKDLAAAKDSAAILADENLVDLHSTAMSRITDILKKHNFVPRNFNPQLAYFDKQFLKSSMESLGSLIDHFEETKNPQDFRTGIQNWVHRNAVEINKPQLIGGQNGR